MSLRRPVSIGIVTLLLLCVLLVRADVFVMSGDTFTTSGLTTTWPNNATGQFDGVVALTSAWTNGDLATWTLSNFTGSGTITSVSFSVRINSTPFSNDNLTIEYSNDSGGNWYKVAEPRPPTGLTVYGNYTVTASFPTFAHLNNTQVRFGYLRVGPADSVTVGIDGVEMYVTYTPPDTQLPIVYLNRPPNTTWVTSRNVSFNFTPTDNVGFANCSLFLNGTFNQTNQTPVVNGTGNLINVTFSVDSDYLWNVTCRDTSGNVNATNGSYLVRIDTTAPFVYAMQPGNNSINTNTTLNFTLNVSDNAAVAACSLTVDNVVQSSIASPTKGVAINLTASLSSGDHWWTVNCTDENGWQNQTGLRNISIQPITPYIITDTGNYVQGSTAYYTGSNWQHTAIVDINVTLANGTIERFNATANATEQINFTQWIGYGHPVGQYNVSAMQRNDSLFNDTHTFTVTNRTATLTTDMTSYIQGDVVQFTGLLFSPDSNVNLTIVLTNGSRVQTNISVNTTGGFAWNYTLSSTHAVGTHNASARDYNFSNLYANLSFSVDNRTARVQTNASTYVANDSVGILGTLFTAFADISWRIIETFTGALGAEFPKSTVANGTGGFFTSWNVNNTCSGNYTVIAEESNTSARANTTFRIQNTFSSTNISHVTAVEGNRITPGLSNVTAFDDQKQGVGMSAAVLDGYLQFNFSPNIPQNATFVLVNITVEHIRTSNKVNNYQVIINRFGVLTTVGGTGCSGTPPDADANFTCDLTTYITNSSVANNLSVLVNYTRSGGGGGDAQVDAAIVRFSWTGDLKGCVGFGSVVRPPNITSITGPGAIVLNAGTTKAITCNVTVADYNGVGDITGVSATLYLPPNTSASTDDNRTHYTIPSCTQTGQTEYLRNYSCTTDLLYYTWNGTWQCNVTATAVDGTSFSNSSFSVDPLFAINVTSTLMDFGNVYGGGYSGPLTQNVTNIGNQQINVSVYGYGGSPNDGNAFSCATQNITLDNLRFSMSAGDAYGSRTPLTSSLQQLGAFPLAQRNTSISQNASFWQLYVPYNISDTGICTGTVVFHARALG